MSIKWQEAIRVRSKFGFGFGAKNWPDVQFRPGLGYGRKELAQIRFRPKLHAKTAETIELAWSDRKSQIQATALQALRAQGGASIIQDW